MEKGGSEEVPIYGMIIAIWMLGLDHLEEKGYWKKHLPPYKSGMTKGVGVLCDKKIFVGLKCKVYHMTVRQALLYESECWSVKKSLV